MEPRGTEARGTLGKPEDWEIEYLKLVYTDFTVQIQRYLLYIQRATFWGVGVLLGSAGYLTTNVKQVPAPGKAILIASVLVFGGALVFSILRAIKDLKTCAKQVVKIDRFFGAFDVGVYFPSTTLFPAEWKLWGTESWSERHLWMPPVIIYSLAVLIATLAVLRLPH